MGFLKVLTVFIVCISIFGVVISKSTTVGNKNNSTNDNVFFDGSVKCEPCGGIEVKILLHDKHEDLHIKYANCSSSKYWSNFYISDYFDSPNKEDFYADFYYVCNFTKLAEVKKRNARWISDVGGVRYYKFGYIDLRIKKDRENRKRRNHSRKYIF